MVSATLDDPAIDKRIKLRPRKSNGHKVLRDELTANTCKESNRRSVVNTIEALDLLSKGLMPYEARRKMNLTKKAFHAVEHRLSRLAIKYQARKIEELVFYAELKHNRIYREALEAFEQSKTDAKGNKRPGNPIFLQVANETLRDIRKLLGLDKSTDFINNGNMAILNWDSLHSIAQIQPEMAAIQTVDPIEERIRQLEKIAQEREFELKETITKEEIEQESSNRVIEISAQPISDESISFQETVEPEPAKKVKLKLKQKVIVSSNSDDIFAV